MKDIDGELNNIDENVNFSVIDKERPKKSKILSGFFFKKECMSRVITESGRFVPVTILSLIKTTVLSTNTLNKKANVFVEYGGKINQPVAGILKQSGQLSDKRFGKLNDQQSDDAQKAQINDVQRGKIKTVEMYSDDLSALNFDQFDIGDMVDAVSTSKGKGFTGRIKRWNHRRRPESHGSSLDHRSGGSSGSFQNRSKSKPGTKLAGHLGCERVTMQNLQVVSKYEDNSGKFLLIKGSVPGPNNSLVYVRRAKKYESRC